MQTTTWDIYFASLVAMTLHPGAGRGDHYQLSLTDCAQLADQMMEIRKRRLECRSPQQQSSQEEPSQEEQSPPWDRQMPTAKAPSPQHSKWHSKNE